MFFARGHKAIEPTFGHFHIAVEQDDPIKIKLRHQGLQPSVVPPRKTVVVIQRDHMDLGGSLGQPIHTLVGGTVVDDDDPIRSTRVGQDRRQKTLKVSEPIPIQNGHRHAA